MRCAIPLVLFFHMLFGCTHMEPRDRKPSASYDLETVVEAVQYAIDNSASDEAWTATAEEKEHWKEVCGAATSDAAKFCGRMRSSSESLCEAQCDDECSPIDALFCEGLADGSLHHEICVAQDPNRSFSEWCGLANQCKQVRKDQSRVCDALKAISLPKLQKAELVLKVEESAGGGAGLSLFVVEFGGSESSTSASTVTLELRPRVREVEYGGIESLEHGARVVSSGAASMSGNLAKLITSAVRAGTLEIVDTDGKTLKPPLALAGFNVVLALSVTSEGKLTVGKEWDSVPAKVGFNIEGKDTLKNTLTLTYARDGN